MGEGGLRQRPDESAPGDDAAIPDEERLVGSDVPRREDRALLTGQATFVDDRATDDVAHLAFVRSEEAHATVDGIETSAAESMDGVLGVYTWADVAASETPGVLPIASSALDCDVPGHPVLARDRVRYHGQPIAAVVATDRYRARDAAEVVVVDYDPLSTVVDPVAATGDDAPTLYPDAPDNVAVTSELGDRAATDRAFEGAETVVEVDLVNNRLIPSALEPRAALARWHGDDERLTVEMTSQAPHRHRAKLSHTLGLPERKIQLIAPAVGGGFGHKGHHHPGEAMAAWCAKRLDRPVGWTATRSENYRAGAHGRDHVTHAELALDEAGRFVGLRAETHAGVGGYGLGGSAAMPGWYGRLLSGQYAIPAIHCETRAVFTTTAPVHSYRGAGRPEAIYVVERLAGAAARELGVDPADLRRKNQIEAFPHETPVGADYDSGDYEATMDRALSGVDYHGIRRGPDRTDDGRYRGVGLACYVESTGGGYESGVVRVLPDGGVVVSAGTHSHGQGHETTYAQIVADVLELPTGEIDVREGDSDAIPTGVGTFGSRSAITGGNAVAESAETVLAKARRIAAHRLEVPVEALAYADGGFREPAAVGRDRAGDASGGQDGATRDDGGPATTDSLSFADVASAAYGRGLPAELGPGLEATTFYEPEGTAYTFGTHVAVVAVDPGTGAVDVERYLAVDDCGVRINPPIVEGQVHGGVAQGLGQARYEQAVYDESGRLRTDRLTRYGVPRAGHLPEIETDATETPSPRNELGVKGIGEAGTCAAPPALVNAVLDALEPLGVDSVDMPLTDETVWRAIEDARAGGGGAT